MKQFLFLALSATALALFSALCPGRAGEMKDKWDFVTDAKKLATFFTPYGPAPARSIEREAKGFRFGISGAGKDRSQTGVYSRFALARDFEVSVSFDWTNVTEPTEGYGVSVGIAIECDDAGVFLARGHQPKQRSGAFLVTEAKKKKDGGWSYPTTPYTTRATSGRLVIKREKAIILCLAGEGAAEPEELCRLEKFTTGTVRKLRIFADTGNSPTALDARVSNIVVQAEEITADLALRERPGGGWWWWLVVGILVVVGAVGGFVAVRRRWQGD